MSSIKYTKSHEWLSLGDDGIVTMGISNLAQDSLGDIVFIELPEVGKTFAAGDTIGAIESVKAASDLYAGIAGEVVEVNTKLADDQSLINSSAEKDGWIMKLKPADKSALDGLMDAAAYKAFCDEAK